jgi:Plasmid recombination enzyme.
MKGYAILRFDKKSGSAAGIEAHHERRKEEYKSNPDIRTEHSEQNIHLITPEDRYNQEIKSRIKTAEEANKDFLVRKNSVRYVDTLITASPNYFTLKRPEEIERYFKVALGFFEEKVDERNIISAVIHVDEETPHMHLVFVPLTEDYRLSAKDIIGGPAGCRKWQDEFFEKMSGAFPDLLRGRDVKTTGRKHLPVQEFKEVTSEDDRFRLWKLENEVKSSRKYVDSIPTEIKKDIEKHIAEETRQKSKKERDLK